MLRKSGHDEPAKYNYHFKHMTTVGEPIEPRGLALGITTWWESEGPDRGYVGKPKTADSVAHQTSVRPNEAGQPGSRRAGNLSLNHGRNNEPVAAGSGKAATSAFAIPGRDHQTIWADRDRFVSQYYSKILQGSQQQGLARLALFCGGRSCAGRGTAIFGYWDAWMMSSTWPVTAWALRKSESACLTVSEVAEAAVVPVVDEDQGPRARGLYPRCNRPAGQSGDCGQGQQGH